MEVINIETFNPKPIVIKNGGGEKIAEIKKVPAMVNVILFQDNDLFSGLIETMQQPAENQGKHLFSLYKKHSEKIREILSLALGKDEHFISENFSFFDEMQILLAVINSIVEETKFQQSKKKNTIVNTNRACDISRIICDIASHYHLPILPDEYLYELSWREICNLLENINPAPPKTLQQNGDFQRVSSLADL